MKIETHTTIAPAGQSRISARPSPQVSGRSVDQQDVSSGARLLSRNQDQLSEQLASRNNVIQRFARNLNEPVILHDRTLDRIIHNLKFT
jgi:hypothetical protein